MNLSSQIRPIRAVELRYQVQAQQMQGPMLRERTSRFLAAILDPYLGWHFAVCDLMICYTTVFFGNPQSRKFTMGSETCRMQKNLTF
jgi:hypothetical protein